MRTQDLEYRDAAGKRYVGFLAAPDKPSGPAVLVAHNAPGVSDFERGIARRLAGLGYVALCADYVGDGDVVAPADIPARLELPVVLVVGLRLGCLNHALLTVEAMQARGLYLAGWVANRIDPTMARATENLQALRARIKAPLLGTVRYKQNQQASQVARMLDIGQLDVRLRARSGRRS